MLQLNNCYRHGAFLSFEKSEKYGIKFDSGKGLLIFVILLMSKIYVTRNCGLIPVTGKRFFYSPKHPHHIWGPYNLPL
jgi:hypothetical protein